MRHFPDSFTVADDVQQLVQQLIADRPTFAPLRRARIGTLFCARVILDRGSLARAVIVVPAQISSKQVERLFHEWALAQLLRPQHQGELPDFVLFVDQALWSANSALEREQLVFHELSHIRQKRDSYDVPRFEKDGRPALKLVPHDAELFYDELITYGRIVPAFDHTALAIAQGAHAHGPRLVKHTA